MYTCAWIPKCLRSFVHAVPCSPTALHAAPARQQFRQSVSNSHQIGPGVFAGADQISHCLHLNFVHRHRGDLAPPQQPSQMRRVASVGRDPIPSRTDQLRRRSDHAVDLGFSQRPREPEPRFGLKSPPSRLARPYRLVRAHDAALIYLVDPGGRDVEERADDLHFISSHRGCQDRVAG